MPLGPDVRFRFRKLKGGRKQRLAFRGPQTKGQRPLEVTTFGKSGRKGKTRRLRTE